MQAGKLGDVIDTFICDDKKQIEIRLKDILEGKIPGIEGKI